MMLRVDGARIRRRLEVLGSIGRTADGGVTRPAFSPEAMRAQAVCGKWMADVGLTVWTDAAGNLIGRWERDRASGRQPSVVIGSHLDTVPGGGVFDGALGVVAGLEVVERLLEERVEVPCPVEVVAHADEEGAYSGTSGSRAIFGLLRDEDLAGRRPGKDSLAEAMAKAGLDPSRVGEARREPRDFRAYLELHIEQGPVLETLGVPVGIVTGIVGIDRYVVEVPGRARHAGTTPVADREDALVKAIPLITGWREYLLRRAPDLIGNVGDVRVAPGASNVVPGHATLSVELRSLQPEWLDEGGQHLAGLAAAVPGATLRRTGRERGSPLSPRLMARLEEIAANLGLATRRLPSGAGHDAQIWARHVPSAMLFVPSRQGVSHAADEWTDWEDVTPAADVLLNTVAGIAARGEEPL